MVLYNNLNIDREDLVEAKLPGGMGGARSVRVQGPDGKDSPAEVVDGKAVFVAKVPSVGYAVYHVMPAGKERAGRALKVTNNSLETIATW